MLLLHDEERRWEFPSRFNAIDIEQRAWKVHAELCERFGDLGFDDWIQDASFHVAIVFKPYEATTSTARRQPEVRFSNFGNLATLTFEDLLPENARHAIVESLSKHDFVFVDADELDEPYDGVMSTEGSTITWWTRYFDFL